MGQPLALTPILSAQEKTRLQQLELTVEKNLSGFLAAGRALAEIRDSRLYREHYSSFTDYARERFGLCRSTADQIVRSTETAELLLANGIEVSVGVSEAAIRPLNALPSAELQVASWKLVNAVCPERAPTQPVVGKVVRTIRNALETPGTNGAGHKPRSREHNARETAFIAPVQRLAKWANFDAASVVNHVERLPSALNIFTALGIMASRCEAAKRELARRFPELRGRNV